MQIRVKLFATHRVGRFKERLMEYPPGSPIGKVVAALGIPPESLGIVLLNGNPATLQDKLKDDDTLAFFPNIAGG